MSYIETVMLVDSPSFAAWKNTTTSGEVDAAVQIRCHDKSIIIGGFSLEQLKLLRDTINVAIVQMEEDADG